MSLVKSSSGRIVGGSRGRLRASATLLDSNQEPGLEPGGSGVGLGDGAGQGLVVHVDDHPLSLDVVLELLDRGGDGQKFPVEGGVPGLGVG